MTLFNRMVSIMFTSSLVYSTAVAEPLGPFPKMPDYLKTKKVQSQDPNLDKQVDKSKTEADFCSYCSERTPAVQNQKAIKAVHDTIKTEVVKKSTVPHVEAAGKWNQFPEVVKYSESKQAESTISFALKNKYAKSKAYCYRAVKKALVAAGAVKKYPPSEHAKQAVGDLKKEGFINMLDHPSYSKLIKTPDDAPKGAILVYANNTHESGDTQIKEDWGSDSGYVNDFYSKNTFLESPKARRYARAGQPYKVIGVMIKTSTGNPI